MNLIPYKAVFTQSLCCYMACTVTVASSNNLLVSVQDFIKVAFSQYVSTNILLRMISEFSEVIGVFFLLFSLRPQQKQI